MEGRHCFNPETGCNDGTLTLPVLEYNHDLGCSVTGGYVYRGRAYARLAGIYVYGDYCSGRIWGAGQYAPEAWTATQLLDTDFTITCFGEDERGELYVADYAAETGTLYRINAFYRSELKLDLASHAFGSLATGLEQALPIELSNRGIADLVIEALSITGEDAGHFSISSDACTGSPVPDGGTCTFDLLFSPSSAGPKTATLVISSNDPQTPDRRIPLSGEGKSLKGDINGDGRIDLADVILGLQVAALLKKEGPFSLGADVDGDERVGIEEVIYDLREVSGLEGQPSQSFETARSTLSRNLSPDASPSDLQALAAGNNAFALDLYQALREEAGNLFLSPYSISLALAMTFAGARSETATQMAQVLHFTLPPERLHPAFNALDLELARRGEGAQGMDGEPFRLNIANAVWGQMDFPFKAPFLDTLAENYDAGVKLLDFQTAWEPARLLINDWVEEKTEDRIKDLIPEGAVDHLTRLVLTNAIYFNAAWAFPFQETATIDDTFHLPDGQSVSVPMMRQTAHFGYVDGEGFQAVELPYDGLELSMLLSLIHI